MATAPRGWLGDTQWELVRGLLPILCADVFVIQPPSLTGPVRSVGLILRDTPHQGRRWCLVGGRVIFKETLEHAIVRQVQTTLGDDAQPLLPFPLWPAHIAQYFPDPRAGYFLDPRQHSVALTFIIPIAGSVSAQGEALSFQWFHPGRLPPPDEFGFGHDRVAAACVEALETRGRIPS